MSERKSWMPALRMCNLACAVLMALLIILQFLPFGYNVGGEYLTPGEYQVVKDVGGILPNGEAYVEQETEYASIADAVWQWKVRRSPAFGETHMFILLFGFWGLVVCLKNRSSSFAGIPATVCGFFAAAGYWGGYLLGVNDLGEGIGWFWHAMISTLLLAAGIALLVIHIRKVICWFTLDEREYIKMWK